MNQTVNDAVVPMDRLAKVYIKIRSRLAVLQQEFEAQEAELKGQMKEVADAMRDQLLASGATTMKTEFGTVILGKKTKYWVSDWDDFYNFMLEQGVPQLLEKRVAQKNMAEFLETHPGLRPQALNSDTSYDISVRRPNS